MDNELKSTSNVADAVAPIQPNQSALRWERVKHRIWVFALTLLAVILTGYSQSALSPEKLNSLIINISQINGLFSIIIVCFLCVLFGIFQVGKNRIIDFLKSSEVNYSKMVGRLEAGVYVSYTCLAYSIVVSFLIFHGTLPIGILQFILTLSYLALFFSFYYGIKFVTCYLPLFYFQQK